MIHDENGHAIPFADHDAVIEETATDPNAGDPETWPLTTDEWCWVPSAEDLADYSAWCQHIERLDAIRREDDAEYEMRMRYGN